MTLRSAPSVKIDSKGFVNAHARLGNRLGAARLSLFLAL